MLIRIPDQTVSSRMLSLHSIQRAVSGVGFDGASRFVLSAMMVP